MTRWLSVHYPRTSMVAFTTAQALVFTRLVA